MSSDLRLLVGLGNPGSKYGITRHNVGFMALERLANKESVAFSASKKLQAQVAEVGVGLTKKRLLMPNTYMNESGRSVKAAMDWFGLKNDQVLIIADDIDLPIGKIRFRFQGSSGGHNGIKSIINHLGNERFCRIKIGIGNPIQNKINRRSNTISHVLGAFNIKEKAIIETTLDKVLIGLEIIEKEGLERASNYINSIKPELHEI